MMRPRVLLVGETNRAEFRPAMEWLEQNAAVLCADGISHAAKQLAHLDDPVDLVVVVESRPGVHAAGDFERLRQAAPLTRMVRLLGSWCEGELRTGDLPAGVMRTYWHQWPACIATEFARIEKGNCPAWGLPLTFAADESLDSVSRRPLPRRRGLIVVDTANTETSETLADVLGAAGYCTVWLDPTRPTRVQGVTAVIWDRSRCEQEEMAEIERLAGSFHPAPVVAMLGFPRSGDYERALAAGAAGVISKPYRIGDLFWQLDRVSQLDKRDAIESAA